jgi:hypothetical protein
MKRRSFIKSSALLAGSAAVTIPATASVNADVKQKCIYEWKVYHLSGTGNAKGQLMSFFKEALIPFLNKRNCSLAAFNDYSLEEPAKLYVLTAYPDSKAYFDVRAEMMTDNDFLAASKKYDSIPAAGALYDRYETFVLEAFDRYPNVIFQNDKKGLFELRLYESASEDAGRRKIKMFNNEEIDLFLKVGLNPVFFGKIIGGQHMPALLYMVGFKDMADRDATWGVFGGHPDWKAMSSKAEYADTVSRIQRIFLTPELI